MDTQKADNFLTDLHKAAGFVHPSTYCMHSFLNEYISQFHLCKQYNSCNLHNQCIYNSSSYNCKNAIIWMFISLLRRLNQESKFTMGLYYCDLKIKKEIIGKKFNFKKFNSTSLEFTSTPYIPQRYPSMFVHVISVLY